MQQRLDRIYEDVENLQTNLDGSLENGSMLESKTYMKDNKIEVKVWSYFEKSLAYNQLLLVDKVCYKCNGIEISCWEITNMETIDYEHCIGFDYDYKEQSPIMVWAGGAQQ